MNVRRKINSNFFMDKSRVKHLLALKANKIMKYKILASITAGQHETIYRLNYAPICKVSLVGQVVNIARCIL